VERIFYVLYSFEYNIILGKLLFYEFALATDRDIFKKRSAETLSLPHNRTSAQHFAFAISNIQTIITIKVMYHLSLDNYA
jgi:hypothetical protein